MRMPRLWRSRRIWTRRSRTCCARPQPEARGRRGYSYLLLVSRRFHLGPSLRDARSSTKARRRVAPMITTGSMIFGMSLALFTQVHVAISLIGIAAGFLVIFGMMAANKMVLWTELFLI